MDDLPQYCRQVEDHLTQVNGGHLVRIVGPGFDLVRQWAHDDIPLSVVFRAIDQKAERHRQGRSTRPLRIEFCESDVREIYAAWRRAVGLPLRAGAAPEAEEDDRSVTTAARRRPSLSKHLDRVIERLTRVSGRLEFAESFRETLGAVLEQVTILRDQARTLRGSVRDDLARQLIPIDRSVIASARSTAAPDILATLERVATAELAPFRGRLAGSAWHDALDATVDRLLRDHYGLPVIEMGF